MLRARGEEEGGERVSSIARRTSTTKGRDALLARAQVLGDVDEAAENSSSQLLAEQEERRERETVDALGLRRRLPRDVRVDLAPAENAVRLDEPPLAVLLHLLDPAARDARRLALSDREVGALLLRVARPARHPDEQADLGALELEADLAAGRRRRPCRLAVPLDPGEVVRVLNGHERLVAVDRLAVRNDGFGRGRDAPLLRGGRRTSARGRRAARESSRTHRAVHLEGRDLAGVLLGRPGPCLARWRCR